MRRPQSDLTDRLTSRNLASLASPVFGLRLAAAVSAIVLGVTVGRRLGLTEAGQFFIGMAVALVGATVGRFGLDTAALRHVGASAGTGTADAGPTFRAATALSFVGSAIVAVLIYILSSPLARLLGDSDLEPTIQVAAVAVVARALLAVQVHVLRGTGKATIAEASRAVGPNLLAVGGVLFTSTVAGALGMVSASFGLFALLGILINQRTIPRSPGPTDLRPLLRLALPMFAISTLQLLMAQTNLLVLGAFSTAEEAGRFGAALRLSGVMTMVLTALLAIAAPRIAAYHGAGNHSEIAHIGRRTALLAAAGSLPMLLILLAIPGQLLGLFGSGFEGGDTALRILAIGQFANVSVGAVGYLLMMTGREARALRALMAGAATNLALALALIPPLDATGAALAAALALLVNNAVGLWFVRRELGFWSLPLKLQT